ncbi:zinc finger protein 91-like [Dreissena polymorpha]|uniref:C2H2-type domain-containing protein n=1 Tax=Dreissena polymorpha TaxID=45954 RepID=A0A9D3YVA3_DREPO|nr:zinc finger protein 91-like [Dreissena polymorpha]XP_052254855.1 zinc finger protein 91-like [Dreissena polymorpha]XP_052254856.1 zinc finger protein 91-like [Dreissena polymorpha]KAH3705191.1 hypothetical protein DPMN_080257 [Dreissena polymorpha]
MMTDQMGHICKNSQTSRLGKLKELLTGRQQTKHELKCGGCSQTFVTICALHEHLSEHSETGSYHFDNCTGTAFPKHDSLCAYTQYDPNDTGLINDIIHCTSLTEPSESHEMTYKTVIDAFSNTSTECKRRSNRKIKPNQKYNSDKFIQDVCLEITHHTSKSDKVEQLNANEHDQNAYLGREVSPDLLILDPKDSELGKRTYNTKTCGSIGKNDTSKRKIITSTVENVLHNTNDSTEGKTDPIINEIQSTDEQTATEALLEISECNSERVGSNSKCTKVNKRCRKPICSAHIRQNSSAKSKKDTKYNGDPNSKIRDNSTMVKLSAKSGHLRKCKICGKVGSSAVISYHKHIHQGGYSCEKCGVQLKHPRTLAAHLLQHEAKQFKCDQCGAGFRRKQYLDTHLLIHSGERPFMCEECGQSYRSASCLSRHVRHIHKNLRSHECDICHERFFRIDHMKNHRVRHFEAKLQCKYCGKGFKVLPDLKRHMLIHTGEKTHICPLCSHGFISVFHYYKHMIKKHNIDRCKAKKMKEHFKAISGSGKCSSKGNRVTIASNLVGDSVVTMETESGKFGIGDIYTKELFIAVDEDVDDQKFIATSKKSKNLTKRNIKRIDVDFQTTVTMGQQQADEVQERERTPFHGEGLLDLMGNGSSQTIIGGSDLNMINQYFDDGAESVIVQDCDYAAEIVIDHSLMDP